MSMDSFKDLVDRYIAGQLSEEEKAAFRRLLNDPVHAEELARIMDSQLAARPPGGYHYPEAVNRIKTAIAAKIAAGEQAAAARCIPLLQRYRFAAAAAAAIVLLLGGALLLRTINNKKPSPARLAAATSAPPAPGSNKAVLTLADGSSITLDSTGRQVIRQGDAVIHQQGGQLQYTMQGKGAPASYNTLRTPAGGQYQVTLPDGSRAWLNASSSLRFPTAFNGSERMVELTGEGYFEVAPNPRMPFRVAVNGLQIDVLGTHFNIMAYPEEGQVATTLLEGAVKVSGSRGSVLLRPGQQALHNGSTGRISVGPGDTEGAVAWKNGYFKFSNENIRSVMRRIARWYNVEVEYRGDVGQKAIWGTVSRFSNISDVLGVLELTGSIHFKMEGRKIVVTP